MDYCQKCKNSPCFWILYKTDRIHRNTLLHDSSVSINNGRKSMYQHMCYVVNEGPKGKRRRKEHIACTERGISTLFPRKDGEYMGYMEAYYK